ncbi:MAG TPA: ABC transporter permease [Planctomycetota bacterium]|nr:ABC transporter permease [Planctomycetota bacterium]
MSAKPSAVNSFLLPIFTLAQRELVRFFRQRNRVVGALAQPLIFWVLFGAAFTETFKPPPAFEGMSYREYFFPGTIVMILLFTAIFSTISIIEDRREGFLQSVLVAPVSRLSMVLGKILGGTLLAVLQGLLFLFIGWLSGIPLSPGVLLAVIGMMFLIGFALTGLGFLIAWRMDSTQGFHAIMSVFLLPMWLLSGALFPADGVPSWLGWIMRLDPLTYGMSAFRHVMYSRESIPGLPSLGLSLAITAAFAVITVGASTLMAGTRSTGDLH